ncbi:hypothetical protein TEA_013436 [Camellia sinensis var. sinensis]|uniref:peroxidase n=1 Tax=Camellia sinensis var. sinensis TaxID=542762 RepID=A0A4S4E0L4_CAMSN|nr:hypothetical protein TEA_013436 [Camellia sinensis var. sinensis]
MAFNLSAVSLTTLLLLASCSSFLFGVSEANSYSSSSHHHLVKGLSWSFYEYECPKLESIVRKHLKKVFKEDIGQAAGLLRVHFHDCFVQGCDGSVLLEGSASKPSEQEAPPNLSLKATAFEIINDLHALVQKECGRVVSCADITTLAARDSVYLASSSYSSSSHHHLVKGLSWSFYEYECPKLESIVRKHLKKVFKEDIGQAAGLLRVHFHDCFVQGCDGSVLLEGSASKPSEQEAPPNLSLRATAFEIINDLHALVQKECGRVVSCADITTLAARDSVYLSGGPEYDVPLGRRDSLTFATRNVTLENLPAPTHNASFLLTFAAKKKFDATDLVALSGGHTIGLSHCTSFENRLYPTQDPTVDTDFASDLKVICPTTNSTNTTVLDIRTPNKFDNKYYVDLLHQQGLFTSDQDLYTDERTRDIVESFAHDQNLFYEKFASAMIKMGQLSVLTGGKGEIRANCSVTNSDNLDLASVVVVEEDLETAAELR